MTDADYIDRSEIAKLDAEINRCCIAHDTTGAMKALTARRAIEAALKTAAVGVAVLALLPAMAFAGVSLNLAKTHAKTDLHVLYAQNAGLTPMTVSCAGPAKHITCTGSALSLSGGGGWHAVEVLAVKGGKVKVLTPAYQPAP